MKNEGNVTLSGPGRRRRAKGQKIRQPALHVAVGRTPLSLRTPPTTPLFLLATARAFWFTCLEFQHQKAPLKNSN